MMRSFRAFISANALSLAAVEALLIAASFLAAMIVVFHIAPPALEPVDFLLYDNGIGRITVAVFSLLSGLYFHNLYSDILVRSRILLLEQLCSVVGSAFILQALFASFAPGFRVPIRIMATGAFFAMAAMFALRSFYSARFLQIARWDRLLLVGASPYFAELSEYIDEHPTAGMAIIGRVGGEMRSGEKWLGALDSLSEVVHATDPRHVIVGTPGPVTARLEAKLLTLRFAGYNLESAEGAYERILGKLPIRSILPAQLLYAKDLAPRPRHLFVQWFCTSLLALAGIVLLSPLLAVTAAAMRLTFSGAMLDSELRVGLGGRVFRIRRFRSDSGNARFPALARALARMGVCRLPVLLNILMGDLTIVGPSPDRPEFAEALAREIPFYRHRHNARPGVTGWAQMNLGSAGAVREDTIQRLEYDLYYIKNISLSLDMLILLHAVKAFVLRILGSGPDAVAPAAIKVDS